jgi:hypothetical protein
MEIIKQKSIVLVILPVACLDGGGIRPSEIENFLKKMEKYGNFRNTSCEQMFLVFRPHPPKWKLLNWRWSGNFDSLILCS